MRMLFNMLVKELLQLRRDPKTLSVLFVAPIVQLTILAYGATTDIKQVELAICDLDRTAAQPRARRGFHRLHILSPRCYGQYPGRSRSVVGERQGKGRCHHPRRFLGRASGRSHR